IEGDDVVRDAAAVRRRIGLAGQATAIQLELTGRENLEIMGRLSHMTRATVRGRAAELLERFEIADAADRPAKTYSGGMQRRLDLAASLIAEPSVLFLDEPTTGVGPHGRPGRGEIIASGTPDRLKDAVGGDLLEFIVPDRARLDDAVHAVAGLSDAAPNVETETRRVKVAVGSRAATALVTAD